MKIKFNYILSLFLLFSFSIVKAQLIEKNPINQANANESIELENYAEAVRQFEGLLKKKPDNIDYLFNLGKAYTYSMIDQAKGLELLQEVNNSGSKPVDFEKTLAVSYFKNHEFDKAKAIFQLMADAVTDPVENQNIVDWINQCDRSRKMIQMAIPITFEHLGKEINSDSPDYLPLVNSDESLIIFSTRRAGVVGNLFDFGGYRTADIYTAKHKRNKYSRSRSIGNPNTYGNEETAGSSENGEYMIYHVDSDDNYSDLFVSKKGRRSYMPPGKINSDIVNKRSSEPGASLTNDGNQLYFCSDRDGGFGGFDLYLVKRLPNGEWAQPKNLGPEINTAKDEKFPLIVNNGSKIYFSSNGHHGLGGLDLFMSTMEEGEWSKPENIGYPINTVNDDPSISFSNNPRYGYISTKRDDSFGDLDIYRVIFHDEKEELTLISGSLMRTDSSLIKEEIVIEILDSESGDLFGSYLSNSKTGNFVAILPPGKYSLEIFDAENFNDQNVKLIINDKNDFVKAKSVILLLTDKANKTPSTPQKTVIEEK